LERGVAKKSSGAEHPFPFFMRKRKNMARKKITIILYYIILQRDPGRLRLSQGSSLKPDESKGRFPDERTPMQSLFWVWVWVWDWVHTPHTLLHTLLRGACYRRWKWRSGAG
jgi:hypothetical protein